MRATRYVSVTALATLFALGCATAPPGAPDAAGPLGEVRLESASLGAAVLEPTACQSGEWQLFLGADFADASGLVTRLIVAPEGAATLRFFVSSRPLDPGLILTRADCSQLELSLDRTGWRVNDIHDLRISLRFDCRSGSGDVASGYLATDHCH